MSSMLANQKPLRYPSSRNRSRSSPSPPPVAKSPARDAPKLLRQSTLSRRSRPTTLPAVNSMDFSSSYHASSSSSAASLENSSSDSETADEGPIAFRGRSNSQTTIRKKVQNGNAKKSDSTPPRRTTFTRSRSPKVQPSQSSLSQQAGSFWPAHRPKLSLQTIIFPSSIAFDFSIPFRPWTLSFSIDARKLGECALLVASLYYSATKLAEHSSSLHDPSTLDGFNWWIALEINTLCLLSAALLIFTHSSLRASKAKARVSPLRSVSDPDYQSSPARSVSRRKTQAFIWMSVPKNYRDCLDDGLVSGMIMPILIALSLFHTTLSTPVNTERGALEHWLIDTPRHLSQSKHSYLPTQALLLSRYNLIELSILCSLILGFHVCASWWFEARYRSPSATDGERRSVPRGELRRTWYYILFTCVVALVNVGLHGILRAASLPILQHLNIFDVLVASLFYQFTLYVALRMAHRAFTVGELAVVCFGGTSLFMELLYLTIAQIWPVTTAYIKTYRLPTPLLIYQMALVAGSFLIGFALAPFLVLSRHVASRPLRRLRDPRENQRQKRLLALGFYVGAVLIVGGPIGLWTRWCLDRQDPWLWVIFWLVKGRRPWSRPALLAYWGLLGSLSVAGWNRQLTRWRKNKTRASSEHHSSVGYGSGVSSGNPTTTAPPPPPQDVSATAGESSVSSFSLAGLPNLRGGVDMSNAANELLDAADKHVGTLSLNARRKFFHALAVVMFLPGIAFDPAFTHLAFSVCLALFIFAEYVRYFALYPFGAAVHLFMHDFLDSKDSGTAILSHFFLLTGCAGSLWLESGKPIQNFTGTLVLGVGDALASIVGKRAGKHRWSPSTYKTVEGSIAFTVSVTSFAWLLRLCSLSGEFELPPYFVMVMLSSLLEALSEQNDNLILPLYTWSMLTLV